MPDWLSRLTNDLQNVWGKFSPTEKVVTATVTLIILGGLIAIPLGIYSFQQNQLLASGLSPRDVGHLKAWLDEKAVTYSIQDNGTSIYVSENPYGLMADYALNAENKPLGGYGVLLNGPLSQTREQFNETKLRAHQEELELGIVQGSDRIKAAKVFITQAQNRTFKSDSTKPTASVKLVTEGQELERQQVQGIQWLIANAVPGLKPSDVKVMDEVHNVLSGYEELSDSEKWTTEQLRAEAATEQKLVRAASNILARVTGGEENYAVNAIVDLDYDSIEINEKYIDTENSLDIHVKTEESEDINEPVSGVPGETSNNPQAPQAVAQPGGQNSRSTMESREIDTQPRVTRETTRKVAPGKILAQQVTIAINQKPELVDGKVTYVPRTEEDLLALQKQLKTAVGHIDDSTQYFFSLEEFAFDTSQEDEVAIATSRESLMRNIESGIFLVFALILIGVFFYFLRKVFSLQPEIVESEYVREEVILPVSPHAALAEFGLKPIEEGAALEGDAKKSKMIKEQIEIYAQEHPDSVAEILKAWISE